jgi:hypothetical protein
MSDVAPARLAYGTVAAVFPSPAPAAAAAAALEARGYPRALIAVLTGQPWEGDEPRQTGYVPDPELRFQLTPTSPPAINGATPLPPPLAAFAGEVLGARSRRRNPALWPLLLLVVAVAATIIALVTSRDWLVPTLIGTIAFHIVAGAFVLAYAHNHVITFPFRERIPDVEETLEQGGALMTVYCTLPYARPIQALLTEHGGQVIGYAPEVVYPVPA